MLECRVSTTLQRPVDNSRDDPHGRARAPRSSWNSGPRALQTALAVLTAEASQAPKATPLLA
eukprot:3551357-Pyramimonas_sp.AAC.1